MSSVTKKKNAENPQGRVVSQAAAWSGPLPPPSIMEGYERILPGAVERIMTMAESESQHRHRMDELCAQEHIAARKDLNKTNRNGQYFAFTIVAVATLGAFYSVTIKADFRIVGLFLGLPLGMIVTAFCNSNKSK